MKIKIKNQIVHDRRVYYVNVGIVQMALTRFKIYLRYCTMQSCEFFLVTEKCKRVAGHEELAGEQMMAPALTF